MWCRDDWVERTWSPRLLPDASCPGNAPPPPSNTHALSVMTTASFKKKRFQIHLRWTFSSSLPGETANKTSPVMHRWHSRHSFSFSSCCSQTNDQILAAWAAACRLNANTLWLPQRDRGDWNICPVTQRAALCWNVDESSLLASLLPISSTQEWVKKSPLDAGNVYIF